MGILDGRPILVVEDEMLVMMNLEVALEDMGCSSVCPVATVMKALAMLNEQNFDLAILDVNLGGEKSYPLQIFLLLEAYRLPSLPVIRTTATEQI